MTKRDYNTIFTYANDTAASNTTESLIMCCDSVKVLVDLERLIKPKLHYSDLWWICCTTSRKINPQEIEVMECGSK